eukprot:1194470-Pleurochrysis_carterae.AAC.1
MCMQLVFAVLGAHCVFWFASGPQSGHSWLHNNNDRHSPPMESANPALPATRMEVIKAPKI